MTGSDLGRAFEGTVKLAIIGIIAVYVAATMILAGIAYGIFWCYNHVSVH